MRISGLAVTLIAALAVSSLEARTITFSGLKWYVRSSGGTLSAPGPNVFSDSASNVWVDSQGRLHLKITKRRGRWFCAEVMGAQSFGYGTYRFYLDSPVGSLDPNVVLGMFTWSDDPAYNHREIDIEFARWGRAANANAQFVVQPYTESSNIHRFDVPSVTQTTHSFVWSPNAVDFLSLYGHRTAASSEADVIQKWTGYSSVPLPGNETPRLNLWLANSKAPTDGREVEVIISRVEFIPLP